MKQGIAVLEDGSVSDEDVKKLEQLGYVVIKRRPGTSVDFVWGDARQTHVFDDSPDRLSKRA